MKVKVILEFTKTRSGKVIVGCFAALILILAIFALIPNTSPLKINLEAQIGNRIIRGSIALEDGQVADEEDADKTDVSNEEFSVELKVRLVDSDDKTWHDTVEADIGDIVEFQLQYKNISDESHKQVVVRDVLPKSLQYIEGTTKLYNTDYPDGAVAKQDTITTEGINIGNYAADANAFVRFRAEVIGDTMADGDNELVNWIQVQAGTDKQIIQDSAKVMVQKTE